MQTEELVAALVQDLRPVQPLRSPGHRAVLWSVVAAGAVLAGVVSFGARSDIGVRLTQVDFAWTLVVAALVGGVASVAALIQAVPGAERAAIPRRAAFTLLVLWGLGLGTVAIFEGSSLASDSHWRACFLRVIGVGFVPALALSLMIRHAAALRPGLAGALAAVAAMAAATIAVQIACPLDAPGHALSGHFGPVLLAGAIGAMTGRRLLTRF